MKSLADPYIEGELIFWVDKAGKLVNNSCPYKQDDEMRLLHSNIFF